MGRPEEMEVNYKVIEAKEFLRAKPAGEIDLEYAEEVLTQIALMSRPPTDHEILLDVREAYGNLNYADAYALIAVLGRHRESFRNKIAILARDDEQFDRAHFLELSANYRGFMVGAFTNFEETINWLQSFDGPEDPVE
jgi:hypothetical protein